MWDARHDLGEDSLAGVHPASLHPTRPSASNREQLENAAFVSRTGTYAINSAVKWDSIGDPTGSRIVDSCPGHTGLEVLFSPQRLKPMRLSFNNPVGAGEEQSSSPCTPSSILTYFTRSAV